MAEAQFEVGLHRLIVQTGYTDRYLRADVPMCRLLQLLRLASEREAEARRLQMQQAAFIAWQLQPFLAQKPEGLPGFAEYLRGFGLSEEGGAVASPSSAPARATSAADSLAAAERALAYFREHPARKQGRPAALAALEKRKAARRARRAAPS